MIEIEVKTWDEFKKEISEFRNKYGQYKMPFSGGRSRALRGATLFRGQRCASWKLQTTLERAASEKFSIKRYLYAAVPGATEIESFTGHRWNLKSLPDLANELEQKDFGRIYLPAYDYLVYLRHCGFPSPLLDWSESPYVAAFFACESVDESEEAAVYCYSETPEGSKHSEMGRPEISRRGPNVTTDKRHFSQQAWYTVAVQWDDARKEHSFVPHEEVFSAAEEGQDVLLKIRLPGRLRKTALKDLADYNINYFTLFHTEDALVKTIAMRTFNLRDV
jgi:hypothetical protein